MSDDPSKMAIIPAGALFTVTEGWYTDYRVEGVFRALEDIDAEGLRAEWLQLHPEQGRDRGFEWDEFLAWVFRKGVVEPLRSFEWHLTDSSRADEMDMKDCGVPIFAVPAPLPGEALPHEHARTPDRT